MVRLAVTDETPLQTTWGWKIAAYLFGAGMGAGAYALGALAMVGGFGTRDAALFTMWMGTAAVLFSVLFLIWDLDKPSRFLGVLIKVKRSWLARGAWILMAFGAFAALTLFLGAPAVFTGLSLLFALAVAAYTGILIGTMLARPLWNSPILPALFLVSALSTGVAFVAIGGAILSAGNPGLNRDMLALGQQLRTTHMALVGVELLVLYFYLSIAYGRSRTPVDLMIRGRLSGLFWGGVVLVGLVLPLALELLAADYGGDGARGLELAAYAGVLIGGYLLRRVILWAGIRSTVQFGGPFVIRPEV